MSPLKIYMITWSMLIASWSSRATQNKTRPSQNTILVLVLAPLLRFGGATSRVSTPARAQRTKLSFYKLKWASTQDYQSSSGASLGPSSDAPSKTRTDRSSWPTGRRDITPSILYTAQTRYRTLKNAVYNDAEQKSENLWFVRLNGQGSSCRIKIVVYKKDTDSRVV